MKDIILFCGKLFGGLCGWFFIAPIAVLMPKNKALVVIIGRHDGQFLDNAKYFFLQATQLEPSLRFVFLTEHLENQEYLGYQDEISVIPYPTLRSIFFLLQCNTVVVDDPTWFRHGRAFFLLRTRVIQLWHGAGFKWAELEQWRREVGRNSWTSHAVFVFTRIFLYRVTRRHIRYAAMTATSRFYRDEAFKLIFKARHFLVTGYPRDDFARSLVGPYRKIAWANTDTQVVQHLRQWETNGRRLVLVAPTVRHSGVLPMAFGAETLDRMDAFAAKNKIEFLFKFHPAERNTDYLAGRHFHVLERRSDIYPLFPYLSALVTDYSSIAMDFLLVDRPILMLIPEDDDYVEQDRGLQFDPREMIPGRVVPDWHTLMPALLEEWENDTYTAERAAMRTKVFDDLPQSEAVPKLLAFMREQGWVRP